MENKDEIKHLVAVLTLVAGGFVGLNVLVAPDGITPLGGVLTLGLLGLSVFVWAWIWADSRKSEKQAEALEDAGEALQIPQFTEWNVSAPAPKLSASQNKQEEPATL